MSARARRATVKKVDYAREQEFSDGDVFEDSPDEAPPPSRRRARRPPSTSRKSAATATVLTTAVDYDDDGDAGGPFYDRPVYMEKGYDPSQLPIRERFPFLPEYEEDGSPRIELIVGRRLVDEKEEAASGENKDYNDSHDEAVAGGKDRRARRRSNRNDDEDADEEEDDSDIDEEANGSRSRRRSSSVKKTSKKTASPQKPESSSTPAGEYEYLVKFKGRSYLHLEWMTGADLESMNKSAKGIYRRYLKKLAQGGDDELESPEFDPAFVVPEKILDEADQEITVELTDKELLRWEKQREKERAQNEKDDEDDDEDDEKENEPVRNTINPNVEIPIDASMGNDGSTSSDIKDEKESTNQPDLGGDDVDFKTFSIDTIRQLVERDGPYYPVVEGSDNPYRDGYIKEPPRKPRASYLFFQSAMRSYFQKKFPSALQSELMTIVGDTWQTLSDEEKAPYMQLAQQEAKQYDKERVKLAKAQRPNEVWQPLRRCLMVLERLASDSFADIFLAPVDKNEFPDYEELIDNPMDLGTVRTKLMTKKYQAPEQFARDMRRIWNNCKIYNQHGSAIWHVADYMSKLYERLYHAWVLEFRERYLRWADPRARPWEHSCRTHDGKCKTPDDQMVLCDHCDAMYGIKCLSPPLKKIPTTAWHCADCKPKTKSSKGIRMLSAVAENAARKRAELGDLPKKKIKQTMYLVKWAGLGYEFCTWETKDDINDDALVVRYHRLNHTFADEPDLPEEVLDKLLDETKHVNHTNAGGAFCMPQLRCELYSQTRAFQFLKFGMTVPDKVCSECGPLTKTVASQVLTASGTDDVAKGSSVYHPRVVVECLNQLVFKVEWGEKLDPIPSYSFLPPPMAGEYDTIVPITSKGLMMNVGEVHGSVAFLGYRQFPDGSRGPAELANLVRNVGDKILAVDGCSTIGKSFKDVIVMLREAGKNEFARMRFLDNKYSVCEGELSSVGDKGRYAIDVLKKKFVTDRQRMVVQRKKILEVNDDHAEVKEDANDLSVKDDSDEESDEGSEGEFQPESDDEELVGDKERTPAKEADVAAPSNAENVASENVSSAVSSNQAEHEFSETAITPIAVETQKPTAKTILCRKEVTRSLAFRLLHVDVDYSSDEGGDEDGAYFVDGVDATFNTKDAFTHLTEAKLTKNVSEQKETVPAKQTEFAGLGERAKLVAAALLTSQPPTLDDFDNFPYPSSSEIEESMKANELTEELDSVKTTKRSTVKVEQISVSTGEVVHVWANVESAAATLQLPLNQIKQILTEDYDEELGDEVGGFRWKYALAGAKVTAGAGSTSRGGRKAKEAWLEFRDKLYDPNDPHSYKNGNRLRDYQVDGVNWLASTWYRRQGCILADEMGLGKTVQIVCYIEHLFRVEKIRRPYLVVVPLSTIEHWRREFEAWTDLECCIYHDRQRVWRDVLREYEWYYEDKPHTPDFLKFDVLVTTYDTLIGDFDIVSQIPFRVAVVDEAHRLRNQKGKLLECMREISAKGTLQYGFQSRVLMSGTPLQNDLTELWTLLNFIEPFNFPDLDDFQKKYGNMANQEEVESLQRLISPYMLRRVKEDVAKDIPAKEETVIDVELTGIQKQYYRAIFEHNHAFLSMGTTRQNTPKLMNIQMELRKVCNHPFLLDGVEHREVERQYNEMLEKGAFEGKTPEDQQHMLNEHGYIMTSGKMVLLDKLLPKLREEGHKVLIFSQMVRMLDLLAEYCELRSFKYERLDGRVRGTERQKSIDRFEREPDSFVFMLSTRAGGVGINLTAADICIIFDSDWNPQNDIQAQARCHRIGQTKEVRIYRLITSRSFEQEMFDRASRKLGLEQAVLGTFEKEKEDDKPSQQEMEQLLKKGAYALLEDDNDEITREFCADDIESILAKRTRTRVVEGTKTASWLNKQGFAISKQKFTTEAGKDSLDMDDPLFWQKVMPDFVTPSIMMQKLNDLQDEIEGRVRGPGRGRKRGRPRKNFLKSAEGDVAPETEAKLQDVPDVHGDVASESQPEENQRAPEIDALMSHETLDEILSDEENEVGKNPKIELSRANIRRVQKFISDLKSMMQNLFEEGDELPNDEKDICQKLLLTISMKESIFNDDQRHLARVLLKRFEGDRRRRCRTSEQARVAPRNDSEVGTPIREELMIVSKKKKKKKKKKDQDDDEEQPRKRKKPESTGDGDYVGEDGYLHHSDSEADWSDVGEDIYGVAKKKDRISRKEARRRRHWAADDDDATAAGRAWPVFPRQYVKRVLTAVLDEVMKYDKERGGVFSAPVSKGEFPEYYEQIKKPMDYGTMKEKLENGEYRSAQAMQKDFILILQNCREFNAKSSDIVKEAREQHLRRPKILVEAARKLDLFLSEDGSVLEIFDDEKPSSNSNADGLKTDDSHKRSKKDKKKETVLEERDNCKADETSVKAKKKKKKSLPREAENGEMVSQVEDPVNQSSKPRIRIRISGATTKESESALSNKKGSKRKRPSQDEPEEETPDAEDTVIPKKKMKSENKGTTKKKKRPQRSKADSPEVDESSPPEDVDDDGNNLDESTTPNSSIFADVAFWKKERETLNGTFEAARANLTRFGPWRLPEGISEDKFSDVAKTTLAKMDRNDRYSVFAEAVTDEEAPEYSEMVKNPMDFSTMREKIKTGAYGSGDVAIAACYKDFLLVFDNCRLYNSDESEVSEEAARVLGLLPEAFASSCAAISKRKAN